MRNIFVDTSALCAALDEQDAGHALARAALGTDDPKVTTDHVLVELWHLVRRRFGLREANGAFEQLMVSSTEVEPVGIADLYVALDIGTEFPDQGFSLVDRTSFAVMRRLGISTVATLDNHFTVYRFGPGRRRAFEIAR